MSPLLLPLWTFGCWQPAPFTPPPPANVEASDVLDGTATEIHPGEEAGAGKGDPAEGPVAEEPAGEGDAAVEVAAAEPEEAEAPPAPVDKPVDPYKAHTVGRPITLVGDDGAPVQVITAEGASVTVLVEGTERVKVHCNDCRPEVEGWLQTRVVQR